jgi:hypothetical protein
VSIFGIKKRRKKILEGKEPLSKREINHEPLCEDDEFRKKQSQSNNEDGGNNNAKTLH